MSKLTQKSSKMAGLDPGTLIHIGEASALEPVITAISFSETYYHAKPIAKVEECFTSGKGGIVRWINVDGIHQLDLIEKLGSYFHLHPLTLEDIVNTEQRPKLDDYEDYIFVVLKMFHFDDLTYLLRSEQVSLVFRPDLVISFQERMSDVFNPVRERLRNGKGKLRKQGSDYLAYGLIDAVVDHYFVVLEKLGERIEVLQEELVANPNKRTLQEIHRLKRDMIHLRRSIWPLREVLNIMLREDTPLIQEYTVLYLRDAYDHTVQVIDTIESFREMLSGMVDVYLSSMSNRMNEIVKVLTIISTIFMPLTFISSIYGMNFDWMPELRWSWGYPLVLAFMGGIAGSMLAWFHRKKWL